jgi:hypothetical protein
MTTITAGGPDAGGSQRRAGFARRGSSAVGDLHPATSAVRLFNTVNAAEARCSGLR